MQDKALGTIDQMYDDFVNKLLPTVQEGLVITKDYFVDLFGRYVQFLIVIYILALLAAGLALYFCIKVGKKFKEKFSAAVEKNKGVHWTEKDDDGPLAFGMVVAVAFIGSAVSIGIMFEQGVDIAKAVFIPELRVYEEVMEYKNKATYETQ